jgi:hypothetical protein
MGYTTMEKDTPKDINHNSTGNLTQYETDSQMRDIQSDSITESESEKLSKVISETRQIAGEIYDILDATTESDGGVVTNEYLAESDKFLTFAQKVRDKVRNDPILAEKVAVRQSLTLPSSPETIELDSGDEGDDEEEEGMGVSDWNDPEDENGDVGTGSDPDSDSDFEWENPITPPTSPDGDGHECCNGQDKCQEERFCHFPGPGTDFIPCICISDESSNDSSVLFLGESGIQEVISVQSSVHTTSDGSRHSTTPTPGTPRPGAEINQASTSQLLQPQPQQPTDPPRQRREFLLGDESDVPYESDPIDYIDWDSFYYVKDYPKRYW